MDKRLWLGAAAGGAAFAWWASRRLTEQDLRGQVALVTGGSRGLGYRIAERLAAAGCPLAICSRDLHEIKEAGLRLAGYGSSVMARAVDVSDPAAIHAFVDEVETHFGTVDILVNNAGIIQVGPLEDMTLHDFRQALDIDFWGTVYASRSALPGMRARRRGTIVNITSIGGEIAVPHLLPYSCAKAAALSFSEGLTSELAGSGIRVVTVVPWLMRTGSLPHIFFKGRHDQEWALFRNGQRRLFSVDGDRAAARIVRAIRRGEARVTVGAWAKLAREVHAVAPGLVSRLLGQVARRMPAASDGPAASPAIRGATLSIENP